MAMPRMVGIVFIVSDLLWNQFDAFHHVGKVPKHGSLEYVLMVMVEVK